MDRTQLFRLLIPVPVLRAVTHQPCVLCTKLAINAGIEKIIYKGEYPDGLSMRMLEEAGVEVQIFK